MWKSHRDADRLNREGASRELRGLCPTEIGLGRCERSVGTTVEGLRNSLLNEAVFGQDHQQLRAVSDLVRLLLNFAINPLSEGAPQAVKLLDVVLTLFFSLPIFLGNLFAHVMDVLQAVGNLLLHVPLHLRKLIVDIANVKVLNVVDGDLKACNSFFECINLTFVVLNALHDRRMQVREANN